MAAGATIFLVSCNLDYAPLSYIPEDEYFTNTAELNTGVIGCYNALHGLLYDEWAVTELRADNSRMAITSSTSTTNKDIEQLDQGTISTSSTFVNNYWKAAYEAIYRCNVVLSYIDNASDEYLRNQYAAEAMFIRAHVYFNLVRLWGPVFLVETPISSAEAFGMQRSSKENIYDFIEADLEAIVSGNMIAETMASADLGRINMLAVKALLAKVYMTNYEAGSQKYAEAITLLGEVVASRGGVGMALVPYSQIFATTNEMNDEILFAVRYRSGSLGLGSPFGNLFAPSSSGSNVIIGDGKAYNYATDEILAAFEEGDLRKDVTVAESYYNSVTGEWVITAPCRYLKKYLSPVTMGYDGESDVPVIRMGDVLLLLAEAINETSGPTAEAFAYLNMVRTRAGLAELSSAELPSRYEFRQAVRDERRVELAFENQRFYDLMRWGIASDRISEHLLSEAFYKGYDSYDVKPIECWQVALPIPSTVMNTNPGIAQNPGY